MPSVPIRSFAPISRIADTTQIGAAAQKASNILLRPIGAMRSIPVFERLWAIASSSDIPTTMRAIPAPGGGTLGNSHKTVALKVSRQGKSYLQFYNFPADQARGLFYLGDDGTFTSGDYDFTAGTGLTWTVLATGLDNDARWYGLPMYGQWSLSNGVDDSVCVQLARSKAPGIWRKAGSNIKPSAPIISLTPPSKDANTQAKLEIRAATVVLTFTAAADRFPGAAGNNCIYVATVNDPYSTALSSTLTGSGTTADPYHYIIHTGSDAPSSSNNAVVAFVNGDSKVVGILTAATASSSALLNATSTALTALSAGTGTGTSDGFANRTVNIYARYWDPGTNNLGYEGISSDKSNELIITADTALDILVRVPVDNSVEDGRFDYVRLYMQQGEVPEEAYYLCNPQSPTPNGGTKTGLPIAYADETAKTITSVSVTGNSLRVDGHSFVNGDAVAITSTGSMIGGLTSGQHYYVVQASLNVFKLANTPGGSAINITTAGSGTRTVYRTRHYFTAATHGMTSGDVVRLTSIPSGLASYFSTGVDYWVLVLTANTFSLAATSALVPIGMTTFTGGVPMPSINLTITEKLVRIDSNTIFGQVMEVDQNRPLPHKYTAELNGQVWRGATTQYPERLYPSKTAIEDEIAPEGCNLDEYQIAQGVNASGSATITALYGDGFRLHFHTPGRVGLLPPNDPTKQDFPPSTAGALNGSCLEQWTGGKLYYLGSDFGLYQFDGHRYGKRDSDLVTTGLADYIRSHISATVVGQNPDKAFMFAHVPTQFIWFWLPDADGNAKGFAFDFAAGGLTGPFDAPAVYAADTMEPERPEIIFTDAAGNLFVWDTSAQYDTGDAFPTQAAFTAHATPDTPPTDQEGYPTVTWDGADYRQAVVSEWETGFFDLNSPDTRKVWQGITFTSLHNSRAKIEITVIGKNTGQTITRMFGDPGEFNLTSHSHRILFNFADTAIKLKFRLLSAEQKHWCLRDFTLLYTPAGRG